ncbi:MAG: cobalamin biosynthesis central domain-containing protein [Clostridium sp.]
MGGANRLTEWTENPGCSTGCDDRPPTAKATAIDVWAADHGLVLTDRKLAKEIAAALLDGETVGYFSDYPISQPEGTGYEADVVHRLNVWVTCRRQGGAGHISASDS